MALNQPANSLDLNPLDYVWSVERVTNKSRHPNVTSLRTIEAAFVGMDGFFGHEALSNRTVYNWFAEFQRGRTFLYDEFREGCPSTSVVATNVDAVREMIERDRHMTNREIQASLGIDMKAIYTILHDHLNVRKLYSCWISHNDRSSKRLVLNFIQKNVELMTHCLYSPDLSPNDFFLFPNIKKKMRGERFESPEAAVETFRTLISEVTASEWKKCLEICFERMQKCIDLKSEYFEKQ
ncbi:SETMR methyltransferase, partial [Acromyrmex heyeri]